MIALICIVSLEFLVKQYESILFHIFTSKKIFWWRSQTFFHKIKLLAQRRNMFDIPKVCIQYQSHCVSISPPPSKSRTIKESKSSISVNWENFLGINSIFRYRLCFFISSVLITTKLVPLTIYKMKLNSFSIKIKPNSRFLEFQENHEILSVIFIFSANLLNCECFRQLKLDHLSYFRPSDRGLRHKFQILICRKTSVKSTL